MHVKGSQSANQARGQSRVNKTRGSETCWEGSYAERTPKRNGTEHFGIVSFGLLFTTQEQKTPHNGVTVSFLRTFCFSSRQNLSTVCERTKTTLTNIPPHVRLFLRFCYFGRVSARHCGLASQFDIATIPSFFSQVSRKLNKRLGLNERLLNELKWESTYQWACSRTTGQRRQCIVLGYSVRLLEGSGGEPLGM